MSKSVVSPANVSKLAQIDDEVAPTIQKLAAHEVEGAELTAQIVAAGAEMLSISLTDTKAWEAYKRSLSLPKAIKCKGDGREAREVATLIWRHHHGDEPSRERVSMYGKAIRIAHESFKGSRDEVLQKVRSFGALKKLVRRSETPQGTSQKRIWVNIPMAEVVIKLSPDGRVEIANHDLNQSLLALWKPGERAAV